jgi:hypothetical protein
VLASYLTQLQRLLHDPNNQYWSQSELTDYINEARYRVAQDTKCLRQLATNAALGLTLTAQTEYYTPQTFLPAPLGAQLVAVMGITIYWGTERIKLRYVPFTRFDAIYRSYQVYYQRPVAFTRMGATLIWIGPNPDQNYPCDWDIAVIPNALATDATVEQIPVPFQEPIQYYAAYKAKWKEQAQGEAQLFLQQYNAVLRWCARGFMQFVQPDPYRIGR